MPLHSNLDAHEKPPETLRYFFKAHQKSDLTGPEASAQVIDPGIISTGSYHEHLLCVGNFTSDSLTAAFAGFLGLDPHENPFKESLANTPIFEFKTLPGQHPRLLLVPSLLPTKVQLRLLDCLFHRDLSSPVHKTNVHLHHHVTYPKSQSNAPMDSVGSSFFSEPQDESFPAKDSKIHKDLTIRDFLNRKLRWITLGGQYDWTHKMYPPGAPPPFPRDIACLLHSFFPDMEAEAAIVNLYSPGDTLSLHRDVSELTDRGLVSISLGCDAVFVIGNKEGLAIRLRSGDAVFMTGEARFAWHGVPKILKGTCPQWMEAWPAKEGEADFEAWRGWMANKRINLNVRQMQEMSNENNP